MSPSSTWVCGCTASPVERWTSPTYTDPGAVAASFDTPLDPTPADAEFVMISSETGARTARDIVEVIEAEGGQSDCPYCGAHFVLVD